MAIPSDVVIRKANASDHSAIVDLIDENGVHDYLPALYPWLVLDPDNFPFVATLDGRVAAYGMASVLDGGLTALFRSGRVHKDFRELGLLRAIFEHVHRFSSDHMPFRLHDSLSVTDERDKNNESVRAYGYRPVLKREGLQMSYQIPKSAPIESVKNNPKAPIDVRALTHFDLYRMFHADSFCRELFPEGRLFSWYVGYRLMPENIRHLVSPWGGAFASFQESCPSTVPSCGTHTSQTDSPKTNIGGGFPSNKHQDNILGTNFPDNVAMVTFYNSHATKYGAFHSLDIYAVPGVSRDHVQAHLRQNLETLQRRFAGQRAALALTFDTNTSMECVTSCLSEQGISELLPHQDKWQVLYERTVKVKRGEGEGEA
ncbi:hypothetical protein EGW08_023224 [Elysia chlorotica]|uniref:N-acetyltransferase domain-containing protein n=1 Tax=Elysia chlorotica TaxID=188477 RepID=A0A433SJ25_ELYCH|nr:hypothetical protein EGW08_023224 [Elysia chlorotica]